ncbi:ATP-binding protein [Cellulomonas sp. Leaf334]|uniref:ATP-binding protein n=1 Tax=Cellulomonas sp. Leaf334 TaxID=1736339 RepID=UPI0006FADFDF|nr:ATP-binding protein [Cellulomonas sp. Leaf334]KQR12057.1 ATP-binding protein [Cellulomonas sp. Leaf334]
MTADAFGTAALRAAVLGAWRVSPARLREDANTEEDHARGYYRDRVVVELAQNAADAATRAGVPGRLLLRLARTDGDRLVLVAANTGAPLDADGVSSLVSMRASAKRDDARAVGRFGVGFAAVRSVSDEISVLSTTGGLRFSVADAAELLAEASQDNPALADEVRRRDRSLPALRLPFAAEGTPPTGYDTAVVLELRDEVAADEVRSLLHDVGDPLLLALPGLVEIVVDDDTGPLRRLADVAERWTVATGEGELPLALMADRPVEERSARAWRVTWALPRDGEALARAEQVVHAPTPTDEPCTVPALLVATFPLDPSRRHVAPGALTEAVLDHAADVYARLAHGRAAAGHDALALVPTGLAAGALDAALRDRIVDRLTRTPLLVPAAPVDGAALVVPERSVALAGSSVHDPGALAALGRRVAALVVLPTGRESQARALGVEIRSLADVVEDLPAASDGGWVELYDALALLADDPQSREALGAVPVPLADGRVVRGARGTVVLDADLADRLGERSLEALGRWGVRVVDPAAAHPVLERLGAQAPDAVGLLTLDAVRRAVVDLADDESESDDVVATVLALVGAADGATLPSEALPWLGLLPLPAADGDRTPADSLVLPGSPAAQLLDDRVLGTVSADAVDRWGAQTLTSVGVRADLVLVHVPDVLADPASVRDGGTDSATLAAQSLDGWDDYLLHLGERLGRGAYVGEAVAVADLDAVDPEAWPRVLGRIAGEPALRRALVDPVRGESSAAAPSYTSWWLRERSELGLGRPFAVGDRLGALLPAAPEAVAHLDAAVQRALGGVAALEELDGAGWTQLLDAWGPVGVSVDLGLAVAVWRSMAPDEPPERLPAVVGPGRVAVVHAEDAAVADHPMWYQRTDVAALVPGTEATAALLDLPFAGDLADGDVSAGGEVGDVPAGVRALLPDAPGTWVQHDDLTVDGAPVDWWVEDSVVHAVHLAGLAAGLAQAAGRWDLRYAVEVLLTDPDRAGEIALDVVEGGRPDGRLSDLSGTR